MVYTETRRIEFRSFQTGMTFDQTLLYISWRFLTALSFFFSLYYVSKVMNEIGICAGWMNVSHFETVICIDTPRRIWIKYSLDDINVLINPTESRMHSEMPIFLLVYDGKIISKFPLPVFSLSLLICTYVRHIYACVNLVLQLVDTDSNGS